MKTKPEVIQDIIEKSKEYNLNMKEQWAYIIATVEWETAGTFQPVREAYWQTEEWRKKNFRYYPYYGRGFVQLTWLKNYENYTTKLGIDLINEPDLAMKYDIAMTILIDGFKEGSFTGKKLEDYVNSKIIDYINARRCINGIDKAGKIAAKAFEYLRGL